MKDHVYNHALLGMQLIKPHASVRLALKAVKNVRHLETKMEAIHFIKLVQNVNYTINYIILLIYQKYMPQTILRLFSLNCLETLAP